MKLIVGLGNPGEKYVGTRHNLGWRVLDAQVSSIKYQVLWEESKKFKASIVKTKDALFVKPRTFMNSSGLAVKVLTAYYKLPATDVIVIHDDVDLPLGKIKIRLGGSAAGHHGVESVISAVGDQFIRVRLGIGPEANLDSINVEHFVLEKFMPNEKTKVKRMVKKAAEAIELLLEKGLETAQNQYN
ncbi:aminoacyl-tRNA hydrolase [Candidatus Daviesbacteria bacterium]|nr:aminoacyl-tRNA hydrolase [Candidatus Daviesbacteria bacterium]